MRDNTRYESDNLRFKASQCCHELCRDACVQGAMPAPSFSRTTAIQALRTSDNIEQLKGNLKEEHILKVGPQFRPGLPSVALTPKFES